MLDESRTSESRALVATFVNSGSFDFAGAIHSRAEARDAIEKGVAKAALVIPPGFMRDIKRGRTAQAQVLVNAADPQTSAAALSGGQLATQARAAATKACSLPSGTST